MPPVSRIYLDHAATTPVLPVAREAMAQALELWANPSSPHAEGRKARAMVEDARARIKAALGWDGELIFTSGASDAIAVALKGAKAPLAGVSPVEHDSVLRLSGQAPRLRVDADGVVQMPEAIAQQGLYVIQQVNSETGVIQPLDKIAEELHARGALLFADCAQGAGKLPVPSADMIALGAHKLGGPPGRSEEHTSELQSH